MSDQVEDFGVKIVWPPEEDEARDVKGRRIYAGDYVNDLMLGNLRALVEDADEDVLTLRFSTFAIYDDEGNPMTKDQIEQIAPGRVLQAETRIRKRARLTTVDLMRSPKRDRE